MKVLARKAKEKHSDQTLINQTTMPVPSPSLHITYFEDKEIYCHMVPANLFHKILCV